MFNKIFLRKLILLTFLVLSFGSQSLNAQDDRIAFWGASYSSGGFVGMNFFFTDNSGWYTSITAALPFVDGEVDALGNSTSLGPQFSMDDVIAQHIGFFIADFEPFLIGIGLSYGGSYYNSGNNSTEAFLRGGFEIPILYRPLKDVHILILPSYEPMQHTDGGGYDNNRYGATFIGHLLFLDPLTFQLESGIYKYNINHKPTDYEIESGVGLNWKISVGYSF